MKQLSIALLLAAGTILAGCKSNESKPEEAAPPPAAAAAPAPAPVAAKPECPPEPVAKKKGTKESAKAKAAKKGDTPPVDCEPAKPANAASTKAAPPAATPVAAPAKEAEPGKPRVMKSRDGTFDGEVYGNIPAGSKWAKLQIGMHQSEVERILGVTSNIRAYVTAKAWIPFYFGNDAHRYEAVYPGQGSVAYTGGGMGGGQGTLMMINYDPKIQ
jgi:hypothetical protein